MIMNYSMHCPRIECVESNVNKYISGPASSPGANKKISCDRVTI